MITGGSAAARLPPGGKHGYSIAPCGESSRVSGDRLCPSRLDFGHSELSEVLECSLRSLQLIKEAVAAVLTEPGFSEDTFPDLQGPQGPSDVHQRAVSDVWG